MRNRMPLHNTATHNLQARIFLTQRHRGFCCLQIGGAGQRSTKLRGPGWHWSIGTSCSPVHSSCARDLWISHFLSVFVCPSISPAQFLCRLLLSSADAICISGVWSWLNCLRHEAILDMAPIEYWHKLNPCVCSEKIINRGCFVFYFHCMLTSECC